MTSTTRFVYDNGFQKDYLGQMYENTVTFGGFSKTWAMTGWRLGYVAGPQEIIQCMVTMQQYVFSSINSFAQKAAMVALDYNTDPLIEGYKRRRDLIYEGLKDKFKVMKPNGAYFIFPEVPDGDGDAFVKEHWRTTFSSYQAAYFRQENPMYASPLWRVTKTS